MRDRPVLFNGAMVRAIIAGVKQQTRRPVKMPRDVCAECVARSCPHGRDDLMACDGVPNAAGVVFGTTPYLRVPACDHAGVQGACVRAPYNVGDTLWVRECWGVTTGRERGDLGAAVRYRADSAIEAKWMPEANPMPLGLTWTHWRPSIHMPRWASRLSRLSLRVTDVRVERVQDIGEEDAIAEGAPARRMFGDAAIYDRPRGVSHVIGFREIWCDAYGNASWDANPWVWATTFEVIEQEGRGA